MTTKEKTVFKREVERGIHTGTNRFTRIAITTGYKVTVTKTVNEKKIRNNVTKNKTIETH